jgi:molybdenum cofactor biosynthesis enzyme MoaA
MGFVEQLRPFWKDVKTASFLGGEPFLNKLYFKMWEDIAELNPAIEINIITNATVLTDKIRKLFERLRLSVTMSIDSFDRPVYEQIRKNAKYDVMMKNRDEFIALGRFCGRDTGVSFCPMTLNRMEIPDMFAWAISRGVRMHFNNLWHPEELSLRNLDRASLIELAGHCETRLHQEILPKLDRTSSVSVANVERFQELIAQIHGWIRNKH